MTPGGRAAAAIEILAEILTGAPAERTLTRWARASRFAGSKDRAAVRDWVFGALRRRRSLAWAAGVSHDPSAARDEPPEDTARGIIAALLAQAGTDPAAVFSGEGHAPPPLPAATLARLAEPPPPAPAPVARDYPDFLEPLLERSLGAERDAVMAALQRRAPVDLRVNTLRAVRAEAQGYLERENIPTEALAALPTALRVRANERAVMGSTAYRRGLVELQDLSSQIVAEAVGAAPGLTVLDYCAGGGGKTLALAARMANKGLLVAHDVNPNRTKDLPARAARAGADIRLMETAALSALTRACDIVLVDAPCSGSGAWRRNPEAKWRLTPESLAKLEATQDAVLDRALSFVAPGGRLIYATCSLFASENQDRIAALIARRPDLRLGASNWLTPLHHGDGFYHCEIFS